ncbi:MAG: hypothetical protein AWU58_1113 [Methanohalophilus sp. T328-1]|jgi:CRISPR-associated protein Cmr2|nr:MAG: hypothetical protein AWU58_1113 [Methanohalophilus sp. T328-1]
MINDPHNQIIHDFLLKNEFFNITESVIERANKISNTKNKNRKKELKEATANLNEQIKKYPLLYNDILLKSIKLQLEFRNKNISEIVNELDETYWSLKESKMTDLRQLEELYPDNKDIKTFPAYTWLLHIRFKLKKSYTSKDESEFRYSNNPILRDRLLGCPMVTPSTWKGNLRFAARKVDDINNEIINRLFGPESNKEENARKGRLYFYPTFFTGKVEKDVITPLSRETRTPVRGPIDMEVVPAGETGDFYLLYFPYPKGKDWKLEEVTEDLNFTVKALQEMFLEYGFSAKKTSGFGVIHEIFEELSLWWDGKNENKNIASGKVKNFEQLHEEIKMGVVK